MSLLRFTNVVSGTILYDGVDITHIPRQRLRQALTVIPQEATLFNGTVGSNLDPSGEVPDQVLDKALDSCRDIASFQFRELETDHHAAQTPAATTDNSNGHTNGHPELQPLLPAANGTSYATLTPAPAAPSGGISLSTAVNARGENFSHGQRQVVSLCRALVRRSRLMLLDEATASMDYETDRGMQSLLRRELEEAEAEAAVGEGEGGGSGRRTLVTVAHRLRTIADYDRVVVMGAGRVVEVGSPRELYLRRGVFYDMVRHSGEKEELEELIAAQ